MINKKFLIPFLLIVLVAVSAGVVSAADSDNTVLAADSDDTVLAADSDDTVLAADSNDEVLTAIIPVAGDDNAAITQAIAGANDGDTIYLGKDKTYNFNSSVEINKNIILTGENVTLQGIGSNMPDGLIEVYEDGAGSTISGLTFNNLDDVDKYLYNGNTKIKPVGIAIYIANTADVTVDSCVFNNWFNSAIGLSSANFAVVQNSQFYGGTATFINNIPDGPKDRGTYHISAMSSRNTLIYNNAFYDTVCDGVSIAGSSLNSRVIGNYFQDNAFSIYFGGKSTEGTLIENNTFVNCGWFESDVYTTEGVPTGDHVKFTNLPVISVQKSADSFVINNNTFVARNGNVLIKALEGSTAHGGASSIGNITITDNTVEPIDSDVVMSSIDFTYIETYNEIIKPIGEIRIANNVLNGARSTTYWSLAWGDMWGDVSIKAADMGTYISAVDLSDNSITGVLKDAEGIALTGETISYTSGDISGTVETDENGYFNIDNIIGIVDLSFEGYGKYLSSNATVYVQDVSITPILTIPDVVVGEGASDANVIATLTDANGNAISGVKVKVVVGNITKIAKTNENGRIVVDISSLAPGEYKVSSRSAVVGLYKEAKATATATVVSGKITPTMTIPDVEIQQGESGAKAVATIKDADGNAIVGLKTKIVVGDLSKIAKTDANGQISIDITSLAAGEYKISARSAVTDIYNEAKATATATVIAN